MALSTQAVGKRFPGQEYVAGREKIREYARAVGETDPLYLDVEAARAAGHADVVAPPMFAAVYQGPSFAQAMLDPEVGANFAMLVHGAQEFAWAELVVAGDELTTTTTVKEITDRSGLGFYVFEAVSENQRGETTCTGTWTCIVRGVSE